MFVEEPQHDNKVVRCGGRDFLKKIVWFAEEGVAIFNIQEPWYTAGKLEQEASFTPYPRWQACSFVN
jgi:hypothetical protein